MSALVMSVYWRRQIGQRVRGQFDLAVRGDALRGFDAAEIERHHHRQQHGKFDGRYAAAVGGRSRARQRAIAASSIHARASSRRCVRFVFEDRGGGEQIVAAVQIAQIEAEQIDVDRILIIEPQHHDVARAAGIVAEHAGIEGAVRYRQAEIDRRKRRIGLDVDIDAVVAVEDAVDLIADLRLELRGGPAVGLRLAGKDQARRGRRRGLERLAGKEDQRGLQDREQGGDEGRRKQPEFDRGPGVALRDESAGAAAKVDRT